MSAARSKTADHGLAAATNCWNSDLMASKTNENNSETRANTALGNFARGSVAMLFCIKWRARISASPGHRGQGCWLRQVRARDIDDGLPRGFLAGVIVEVWLALHL